MTDRETDRLHPAPASLPGAAHPDKDPALAECDHHSGEESSVILSMDELFAWVSQEIKRKNPLGITYVTPLGEKAT